MEHQELLPQGFQRPGDDWDCVQHGFGDALHLATQLPEEGVVRLDTAVQLSAVGGAALALHGAGGDALVDSGQLRDASCCVAAVVDSSCLAHALQMTVDRVRQAFRHSKSCSSLFHWATMGFFQPKRVLFGGLAARNIAFSTKSAIIVLFYQQQR